MFQFEASEYHGHTSWENTDLKQFGFWEFPGGPVVRPRHFHCHGPGFNPWLGD